jgi:hypothetical protein
MTVWPGLGMTVPFRSAGCAEQHCAIRALSCQGGAFLRKSLRTPDLSFRGSAARTRPHHRIRRATEESTFRLLVVRRDAPDRPCLAVSPPHELRGLPRPASHEPTVDSSALQPVARASDDGVAGPRNDSSLSFSRVHSLTSHCRTPDLSFRGSAARTRPHHRIRRATEESTFWYLVACRGAPDQSCLAVSPPHGLRGLPRPASHEPTVDSSALQPVARAFDDGVAGPRNDSSLSFSRVH